MERHKELLKKLVAEDKAYVSHEPKKDDPNQMVDVVRLRNPKTDITFHDEIRGDITFDTTEHGDFVIARAIDDPLYHFAVVVDDGDADITHVIRGEDHISNTSRHILIQQALGLPHPIYAHVPLLLNTNRTKLSTRTGAKPLYAYRDMGILSDAMLNYLALLGWNPGDDREYLTRDELIESFDLARVQKGSAVFDETKLLSVNQYWMRKLSDDNFLAHLETRFDLGKLALRSNLVSKAIPLLKERAQTFGRFHEMLSGELACLFAEPKLDRALFLAKELPDRPGVGKTALEGLCEYHNRSPRRSACRGDKRSPYAPCKRRGSKKGREVEEQCSGSSAMRFPGKNVPPTLSPSSQYSALLNLFRAYETLLLYSKDERARKYFPMFERSVFCVHSYYRTRTVSR